MKDNLLTKKDSKFIILRKAVRAFCQRPWLAISLAVDGAYLHDYDKDFTEKNSVFEEEMNKVTSHFSRYDGSNFKNWYKPR